MFTALEAEADAQTHAVPSFIYIFCSDSAVEATDGAQTNAIPLFSSDTALEAAAGAQTHVIMISWFNHIFGSDPASGSSSWSTNSRCPLVSCIFWSDSALDAGDCVQTHAVLLVYT